MGSVNKRGNTGDQTLVEKGECMIQIATIQAGNGY